MKREPRNTPDSAQEQAENCDGGWIVVHVVREGVTCMRKVAECQGQT